MTLTVKIRRSPPPEDRQDQPDIFQVPLPPAAKWTALDVLNYIQLHLDGSLSYYRHSVCNRGVCARCAATINGQVRLLCQWVVPPHGELVLEPLPGRTVVRDLVGR